eukprot:CAMPEP_0201526908 /NCGR_PEP_ID=MMETSP0161_2-20130828/33339_1 /ASSEMBLY_ACC=CAM_ASM_000251 /TAXON_ID=180227 /ORGANISM="Neoparamoeba aestuarina, Strain SoJaBio B1-5/56/2" /LENGTH=45 /DNA_ID= /DNA_START= /DNA_END= /DNA_ORIENTATION=
MTITPDIKDSKYIPGRICMVHKGDPKKAAILTHVDSLKYLKTEEA